MLHKKEKNNPHEDFNWEETAPTLAKLKKRNPFNVPENYFEKLPIDILLRASHAKKVSFKGIITSVFHKPAYQIGFAVAAVVIILFALFFDRLDFTKEAVPVLSEISLDDLLLERPDIIEYMDDYYFIETLIARLDQEMSFMQDQGFENDTSLSDDELLDYLSDEDFATDILYEL